MGLEAPQGREIFTKGIAGSLPLSVSSAAHKAGTKPADLRRCAPTVPLVPLTRGEHGCAAASAVGASAPGSADLLKAWIHFGNVA